MDEDIVCWREEEDDLFGTNDTSGYQALILFFVGTKPNMQLLVLTPRGYQTRYHQP